MPSSRALLIKGRFASSTTSDNKSAGFAGESGGGGESSTSHGRALDQHERRWQRGVEPQRPLTVLRTVN